jgi:4a-hydroxytetrahydrobiopterin dehydratase
MMNRHPSALTLEALRALHCAPLGPDQALSGEPLRTLLQTVPHWSVTDGFLVARFTFRSWFETLGFVNAVAWMAQTQDHHPELLVTHNRCDVRWNTHSARGITLNDFICAAHTDALAAAPPAS